MFAAIAKIKGGSEGDIDDRTKSNFVTLRGSQALDAIIGHSEWVEQTRAVIRAVAAYSVQCADHRSQRHRQGTYCPGHP